MRIVAEAVWRGGHRSLLPPSGVSPVRWFAAVPGAVYTATATLAGHRVFDLEAHLNRLLGSLDPAPVDARDLRTALAAALDRFGPGEARVLIEAFPCSSVEVPGAGAVVVLWPARTPAPRLRAAGVCVAVAPGAVRTAPGIKHSAWRLERASLVVDPAAHEHLLIDSDAGILEGFTSNVLGVRGGVLLAPRQGVLPGLARRRILEAARARAVSVEERPIGLGELAKLDELGLCSCGRGLVPVVAVGEQRIGTGHPGSLLAVLHQDWQALRATGARQVCP